MISKLKRFLIIFTTCMFGVSGIASGTCVGKSPVWGTNDNRESCARKQQIKEEKRRLELERQEHELAKSRQRIYGDEKKSDGGAGNGLIKGILIGKQEEEKENPTIILTKHQARIEWMPFLIPGAAQFDEPGTPENMFLNGLAWEYYLNPNLGFGLLIQQYHKSGGKNFDPIMNNLNVAEADATPDYKSRPVLFPGAIDQVRYTHIIPYATFNTQLGSPLWNAVCRFGIGITKADIMYKTVDVKKYPYAKQPSDVSRTDSASILFDVGVERWAENFKYGGALRYINGRHDAGNYNEYFNMSSAQVVFYAQWMFRPLGLL